MNPENSPELLQQSQKSRFYKERLYTLYFWSYQSNEIEVVMDWKHGNQLIRTMILAILKPNK